MRLFIAADIGEKTRIELERLQSWLRRRLPERGVSFTTPKQFHLTIKFLGETEPEVTQRICAELVSLVSAFAAFPVTINTLGTFPETPRSPRVIWAGIQSVPEAAADLHRAVDDFVSQFGFPKENRPFAPHITLARIKSSVAGEAATTLLKEAPSLELSDKITSIAVYESRALKGHHEHAILSIFRLREN